MRYCLHARAGFLRRRRHLYFAVYGHSGDGAYEVYLYDASAYTTGEILLWLIIAAMLLIAIVFVAFFIYKVHQFNQFRCVSRNRSRLRALRQLTRRCAQARHSRAAYRSPGVRRKRRSWCLMRPRRRGWRRSRSRPAPSLTATWQTSLRRCDACCVHAKLVAAWEGR